MTEQETIFSSTGSLGVSRRQYNRLYVNGSQYADNGPEVVQNFERLTDIGQRFEHIGRTVYRGVVDHEVMTHLAETPFIQNIEVALPLAEFGENNSWLMYLSQNRRGRESIHPIEHMIAETERMATRSGCVSDRVSRVVAEGYTLRRSFDAHQVDQLHALWGPTFGWSRQEVLNLSTRLNGMSDSGVWFVAAEHNGQIVSAAMAERLQLPSAHGPLELVESTEWRTHEEHGGNGLMSGVLTALNAQVISDLRDLETPPLIYAECNFQSRADRVGNAVGFNVPARNGECYYAPQILEQNVLVNDGQPVPEGKLRDFTFMYLPVSTIQEEYIPNLDELLAHLR